QVVIRSDDGLTPAISARNNSLNIGILGTGARGFGVEGETLGTNSSGVGVYGDNNQRNDGSWAGYFNGPLGTNGRLLAPAGALFIDHPLDPQNKYLQHSLVA